VQIGLSDGVAANSSPLLVTSAEVDNISTKTLNIFGTGEILVTGSPDLSAANITGINLHTTGNYVATGSAITVANTVTFQSFGDNNNTGSINGGAVDWFVSGAGTVTVDGTIAPNPYGVAVVGGDSFNVTGSGAISIPHGRLDLAVPTNGVEIGVSDGVATNNAPFLITTAELNKIAAGNVIIGANDLGGTTPTGGVLVTGTITLTSNIPTLQVFNLGNYVATGSSITLAPSTTLYNVATNNINSGGISFTTGQSVHLTATGALTIDGSISGGGGFIYLKGATFADTSTISASGIFVDTTNTQIGITDGVATNPSPFLITSAECN
jgi:hypothetical protein